MTVTNRGLFNLSQPNGNHGTVYLSSNAAINNLAGGEVGSRGDNQDPVGDVTGRTFDNLGLVKSGGQDVRIGVASACFRWRHGGLRDAQCIPLRHQCPVPASSIWRDPPFPFQGGTHNVSGALNAGSGTAVSINNATANFGDGAILNLFNGFATSGATLNLTGTSTGALVAAGSTLLSKTGA